MERLKRTTEAMSTRELRGDDDEWAALSSGRIERHAKGLLTEFTTSWTEKLNQKTKLWENTTMDRCGESESGRDEGANDRFSWLWRLQVG